MSGLCHGERLWHWREYLLSSINTRKEHLTDTLSPAEETAMAEKSAPADDTFSLNQPPAGDQTLPVPEDDQPAIEALANSGRPGSSREFNSSVMSYITVSLVTIIAITLFSIFISFWVTELADKDAQAINLSGSMRMQAFHIGLELERGQFERARADVEKLHQTWNHPIFSLQHAALDDRVDQHTPLARHFLHAYGYWLDSCRPVLEQAIEQRQVPVALPQLLETQVTLTDRLVAQFQEEAERKIVNLRSFQLLVLFITVLVGSLIFYLLKNRIERPLSQLTETAEKIRQGDLNQQVEVSGTDELGLLASTFNRMTRSIAESYSVLEERVEQRTLELRQNNIALEFLFSTAREILESREGEFRYADSLSKLGEIIGGHNLELCLFTEQGEQPYLQLLTDKTEHQPCERANCNDCRQLEVQTLNIQNHQRFPIVMGDRRFGIIDLHLDGDQPLPRWQKELVQSVANQFAIALSLSEQKDRDHRFAMLSERTVIARELHDSLAQALSYLQIQVTRLQKSHDKAKFDLQQPIIDELREGLSSAYRQLRELLTTFRLKMDDGGLKSALENTVQHLSERTDMAIELDYQLDNLPLSASEQIHLLQIIREASQNAIHHSHGEHVLIRLSQVDDQQVELLVEDDGVGIPDKPEKLNHYGLAIMNERSRHLGGHINIQPGSKAGTCVSFVFSPSFTEQN